MRWRTVRWTLVFLFLVTGCNQTGLGIFRGWRRDDPPQGTISTKQLVHYLNKNAERMATIRCNDVRIRATKGLGLVGMELDARLACEQPRSFRMRATHRGSGAVEVDIGSNEREFWFFIPKATAAQFYCSYDDLNSGKVAKLPFPFQPEWVLETMGMAKLPAPENFQLQESRDEIKLIQRTKAPDGKLVRKVIVFRRRKADVIKGEPQVKAYYLLDDATGKELCSARIQSVQLDNENAAVMPKRMVLYWPKEGVSLTMTLSSPRANNEFTKNDRSALFVRTPMSDVPSIDLARSNFRHNPASIRRVRGSN